MNSLPPLIALAMLATVALRTAPAQPTNDAFENRLVLTGLVATTTGSNVGAGVESGEPTGGGRRGPGGAQEGGAVRRFGASVWWTWTAPTNGSVQVHTLGSSFDTVLSIYTGRRLSALTRVAQNDEAPGMREVSLATFSAKEGTPYQIQVTGAQPGGPGGGRAATGSVHLALQMLPSVALTAPSNHALFVAPSNLVLSATASSPYGSVTQVEFYRGGELLGSDLTEPYSLVVRDAPPGTNSLSAVVTDSAGMIATSAVVQVAVLRRGVTILSPVDGAEFVSTNRMSVSVTPSLESGAVTNVEFYADGEKFDEDDAPPFRGAWTNVVAGIHRLTAIGEDDGGLRHTSAPVLISVAEPLVSSKAIWRYEDSGADLGTAWRDPRFNDARWPGGPSPLGYGDANRSWPATTNATGPDSRSQYTTAYYRHAFAVTNLPRYTNFFLRVQRDDGIVVYLNGTEVFRQNMPGGAISNNTFALTSVSGADETAWYSAWIGLRDMRPGTNVLAAEVHQSDVTSSDLWFDLELRGIPGIRRNRAPRVHLVRPANDARFLRPPVIRLFADATDADGAVSNVLFFANGTKLGETARSPYEFAWTNAAAGAYALTAVAIDNEGATRASEVATIAVYDPAITWTAYNDHGAGPATHTNATAWNAFQTAGGAPGSEGVLRNIQTGAPLTATLTVLGVGLAGEPRFGAPPPGTPAYDVFHGFIDFGSSNANHAIRLGKDAIAIHFFSGLDRDRRYTVRATAVGGVAAYTNRWTRLSLVGAQSSVAAHTAQVLTATTQPGALMANEAALNTGDNRAGDVAGWDEIVPGADGAFMLVSRQYLGPAPGNATPGPGAYAPVALRLQEVGPAPSVRITAPLAGAAIEGPTNLALAAEVTAVDGVTNVAFFGDGQLLGHSPASPHSTVWNDVPFGRHRLTAVACDASGVCGTSAPVTVTITMPPTNTVPPTVFTQEPLAETTNAELTSVRVIFTEPVAGVDASDLLVNGVAATNVVGGGSNYLFGLAQPAYGDVRVTWAPDHGITDVGWPKRLAFYENNPECSWDYTLVDRTPPVIVAKDPAPFTSLTNLTQITVTFSEPVAGVDAADLLVDHVPAYAVSGSGSNYTFSFSQPPSGLVFISWADDHRITDLAPAHNGFDDREILAHWNYTLDARTVLVQSNSLWSFVKGTNEASTPTNAWRGLSFDASTWSRSAAPFYYGDPYTNADIPGTLLSDMRSHYTCVYLRRTFVLPNPATITDLFLREQCDDGFVAWINGVEVWRENVATNTIGHDGTASRAAQEFGNNGVGYATHTLPDPRRYLVAGTNVLAVQAFNETVESSDFVFNGQLYIFQSDTEVVAARITRRDPTNRYVLNLTNLVVTFSEPVTNVDAADLLINGAGATGVVTSNSTTYTFSFLQPPYGPVKITWASGHGIVDFDISPKPFDPTAAGATWDYILLNPNSPHILSRTPGAEETLTRLTEITVTFNEPLKGVDAADLLINEAPATGVRGSGTNYTFTFPQPAYGGVSVTWATNHGIQDLSVPPNDFDPSWPDHTWTYRLVDQTPPAVASQDPPAGSAVTNLTQLTVTFTEPVGGLNGNDLLLNGRPAKSVSGSNGVYRFAFAQPNASLIEVAWRTNHGIRDLADLPNAFDATAPGATWSYKTVDNVPPAAARIAPGPFVTVRSLREIQITFDEPVTGVDAASLLVNRLPAQQVAGWGAGPYTFVLPQVPTGLVHVAFAPAHAIQDAASPANRFGGGAWTYGLDPGIASDFAVEHVVHISVDGAAGWCLKDYLDNGPEWFTNLVRLRDEGATTLNARCDHEVSVTLPNHTSMFTGRPVRQPKGWTNTLHHGLTIDSDNGTTLHDPRTGNSNVTYQASVFDVVHDHGLSTAFLCGKQAMMLFVRSWDSAHAAADVTGPDNGSNKIDFAYTTANETSYGPSAPVVNQFVRAVETNLLWNYTFIHLEDPDAAGHARRWGSSGYSNGVLIADGQIGRVLKAIQSSPNYSNRTAVIITADHGGGAPPTGHNFATNALNYRIPFLIWGAGIPAGVDAYSLFANRADPGDDRVSFSDTSRPQPLRNGDSGNLALSLLGLPSIPGSSLIPILSPMPEPVDVSPRANGK